MRRNLLMAAALFFAQTSIAMATESASTITANWQPTTEETYVGSIHYTGGLLERGTLQLSQPTELTFIRFQIPEFCQPEIFEAGTITEGISDLAQPTQVPNVFAVNGGRGARTRTVFASFNGPEGQSCHVLVFARSQALPPSPPDEPSNGAPKAVSCIVNEVNASVNAQILTDGVALNVSLPPLRTVMIASNLRFDRSIPRVDFAFDRDITIGYSPITIALNPRVQAHPDCNTSPLYSLRQIQFSNMLEIIRLR